MNTFLDVVYSKGVPQIIYTSNQARCLFNEVATGNQREEIEKFISIKVENLLTLGWNHSEISIKIENCSQNQIKASVFHKFAEESKIFLIFDPLRLFLETKERNLAIEQLGKISQR